jgi:hypothetical protein
MQVSYSLTQLAETQLKKDRREVSPHDIPPMFQSSGELLKLVISYKLNIVLLFSREHLLFFSKSIN